MNANENKCHDYYIAAPRRFDTEALKRIGCLLCALIVLLFTGCSANEQEYSDGMRISGSTHMASASLLERQNNLPAAMKQYQDVIEVEPQRTSAYHGLGRIHFLMGQFDEAENTLTRGIRTNKDVPSLHNNLGYTYLKQRKYEEAEKAFRRALELSPSFQRARMNLGMTLARTNRLSESFSEFRQVLPREDAYFNIAVIRAEEEDYEGAAQALREALAFNPDYEPAMDHLDRIVRIARAENDAKAAMSRLAARNAIASFSEPVGSASITRRPTCAMLDTGANDEDAPEVAETIVAASSNATDADSSNDADTTAAQADEVASVQDTELVGPPIELAARAEDKGTSTATSSAESDAKFGDDSSTPSEDRQPTRVGSLDRSRKDRTVQPTYSANDGKTVVAGKASDPE